MENQAATPINQGDVWDQVTQIVGHAFIERLDSTTRDNFREMMNKASSMGRYADGPVREIQTLMGDRWSALLMHLLHYGPLRFSVLQRLISVVDDNGISRRMLSFSLRALERDGLVLRRVIAAVPPNVEYTLTPLGQGLWQQVYNLVGWLTEHADEIATARDAFAKRRDESPAVQ